MVEALTVTGSAGTEAFGGLTVRGAGRDGSLVALSVCLSAYLVSLILIDIDCWMPCIHHTRYALLDSEYPRELWLACGSLVMVQHGCAGTRY